jgi:NAD(P)-dependent dehydrogenase (short-subunit alcohol dehydrogenase family)
MQLEDRTALVTGAGSGIGRAVAIRFAAAGARVALAGRREDRLRETAEQVAGAGGDCLVLPGDVTSGEDARRMVDGTVKHYGELDVLVNAAGFIASGTIEDTRLEDWDRMFDVNLRSVFQLLQLALPHLEKRPGSAVNVSSVTGVRAFPGILAYCVSKAGVDQLTRCTALELADKGVRVNAINPGVVVTELHRSGGMDAEAYEAFLEHSRQTHPMGRVGMPEEVAELALFLASDASGWITGGTFPIDGGRHLTCAR